LHYLVGWLFEQVGLRGQDDIVVGHGGFADFQIEARITLRRGAHGIVNGTIDLRCVEPPKVQFKIPRRSCVWLEARTPLADIVGRTKPMDTELLELARILAK